MAFSGSSTPVLLGEIFQNVLVHGIRSTTPSDVGRARVESTPSLKRCNYISMKKDSLTLTCGALTAPMSEHPKMPLARVKKHPGESSAWPLTWRFWQQNSLGHRRSWFATGFLPLARTIRGNQVCDERIGHGKDTNLIGPVSHEFSASCGRQSL